MYCCSAGFISGNHSILVYLELFLSYFDTALSLCSIIIRFLPIGLFPSSRPSMTSFRSPSCLRICPTHFFFLFLQVLINILSSPIILNTSSLLTLLVQLNFSIRLHTHFSKLSSLLTSAVFRVQVSDPLRRTLYTIVFTILFFSCSLSRLFRSIRCVLKACFAIAIRVLISFSKLPSSVIMVPKYLKLLTCSSVSPFRVICIGLGLLPIFITLVFLHLSSFNAFLHFRSSYPSSPEGLSLCQLVLLGHQQTLSSEVVDLQLSILHPHLLLPLSQWLQHYKDCW